MSHKKSAKMKVLEERLRNVIRHKIRRLNELELGRDEEEREDEPVDAPQSAPVDVAPEAPPEVPQEPAPEMEPEAPGRAPEPSTTDMAPDTVPDAEPVGLQPDAPSEPEMEPEAPEAEPNGDDMAALTKAKVKIFFDKLSKNETLMNYLNFNSPLEQAEAVQEFASLVGVPKSQLIPILKKVRDISMGDKKGQPQR